jgi:hypothetical protein
MTESSDPPRSSGSPLPEFVDDGDDYWSCTDVLPSWAGFQSRGGPYASKSSKDPSDGTVEVRVKAPLKFAAPAPEQINAYRYLKENDPHIGDLILDAIAEYFYTIPEKYRLSESHTAKFLRKVRRPDDFKRLIGLRGVHVLPVWKDDYAYIGFEFGCAWDSEHGLGVMTHKDRVVSVGNATCSFQIWIARRDAQVNPEH